MSVIVPSAGWPDSLTACLRSLASQTIALPVEVVVVVNGPGSGAAPASWPGVTILHESRQGPAAARNTGVRASRGDVLAFTDADCVADPGWLEVAVAALREEQGGSVIAGAITRSGAGRNAVSLYDSVTFLRQRDYVASSGAFVTANLVVHRTLFERVGPFDPVFGEAAFEDWDWALRARRAGIPVRYEAGAAIDHPCMLRLRELRAKMERLARGNVVFQRKYGRPLLRHDLLVTVRDHARRAWRNETSSHLDRVRLVAVGTAAGFWRWRAFRRMRSPPHAPGSALAQQEPAGSHDGRRHARAER